MAGLNLLPWRDEARKESQKKFVIMVVSAVAVAATAVFGAYTYYQNQIDMQNTRNQYLEAEIKI